MAGKTGSGSSEASARPLAASPTLNLLSPTTKVGFQVAPHISAGIAPTTGEETLPYLTALGDFNNDGQPDVATIVQDQNSVFWLSILLSKGDGTFQPALLTAINFGAHDLFAVGDLNQDGNTDVVLVHSNSVDVLISDGKGSFAPPATYATTISSPAAVALMDANGDKVVDVLVANASPDGSGDSPVATLVGDGTGSFGKPSISHYKGTMTYGVFADLDADGYPDLVTATQVFLGGASDYQSPITLTTATNTCTSPLGLANGSVVIADVTGDGMADILTADCLNQTITAYINLGKGSFSAGTSTWAAYLPENVAIADVNGDGKLDAIVGDFYSMGIVVLLGNNDGTFAVASPGYPVGGDLWTAPVIADFNSDGYPDIVMPSGIADQWESLVYIAGLGNGAFVAPHDYSFTGGAQGTSADSWGIATADLNGDGLPDFVVGNLSNDPNVGVTVFLSNADSPAKSLQLGVNYGSGGNLKFVALADIDGDGNPDLIASNADPTSGDIQVFRGNGDGTFQTKPTTISVVSGAGLGQLVVGDFNGDNKPDVAVLDTGTISSVDQTFTGNVWILLNNSTSGSPAFASPVSYSLTSPGWEIAAADLGNGHVDLVVTQAQSTAVSILLGDGKGAFVPQKDFDMGSFFPAGLAIAQLNPSGHPDLVVAVDDSNAGMGIAVASGNGDGTFDTPVLYPATSKTTGTVNPFPSEVRIADLNGDGNLDLVFTNFGDGAVGVLYGTGQFGSGQSPFYAPVEFAANDCPLVLVLADVNGDGALDAVIDGCGYSDVTTLLNIAANQVSLSPGPVLLVNHGSGQTALAANPHAAPGQFTFTATVAPLPLAGAPLTYMPTGTVTFSDGDAVIGTTIVSAGSASVTPTISAAGTHIITAIYSGDDNYVGQTKATLIQTIDAPASAYLLSANPTSTTLLAGQSAQFVITATPNPKSTDTVNFSCGPLPQGISCSFSPASLTLTGTSPASTTLTVTAAPTFVASGAPAFPAGGLPLTGLSVGVLGSVLLAGFRGKHRARLAPVLLLVALAAVLVATGCSSNPAGTPNPGATPMMIRVIAASGAKSGAQQLNITVTIRP
jgi:hypothetical protein